MPLDPTATGFRAPSATAAYTWKDAALHALSVGAGPEDLALVYERPRLAVLPSLLTTLAFNVSGPLLQRVDAREDAAVFGAQSVRLADGVTLPPEATLRFDGRVDGVYGLGGLGIAELCFDVADAAGRPLAEVGFTVYVDGGAAPGAGRPPRTPRAVAPQTPPDWRVALATRPEQALLYRLGGDLNPLHADPVAAARMADITGGRPILHGLCTTGFVGRAVIRAACGGRVEGLRALSARFARPVWPGDTLVVEGWGNEDVQLRVRTLERPDEDVLTAAVARVT